MENTKNNLIETSEYLSVIIDTAFDSVQELQKQLSYINNTLERQKIALAPYRQMLKHTLSQIKKDLEK